MKFKEFEKYINMIIDAQERDAILGKLLKAEDFIGLSDDLVSAIVTLLEQIFHDHSEWISYWLWELECGKNYIEGSVTIKHKPVPLKTIRDLYQILTVED